MPDPKSLTAERRAEMRAKVLERMSVLQMAYSLGARMTGMTLHADVVHRQCAGLFADIRELLGE